MLMIEKLKANPAKIPSSSRDEIMNMCKSVFADTLTSVDISGSFKRNGLTIRLVDS